MRPRGARSHLHTGGEFDVEVNGGIGAAVRL